MTKDTEPNMFEIQLDYKVTFKPSDFNIWGLAGVLPCLMYSDKKVVRGGSKNLADS